MRNDMYENNWSPFDPKWYQAAFDQFISTADQLFNQNLIIEQGFKLPDADGSRSSVFRNESVLNNSFNEAKLRETLKDIYLNSSHRLIASNHDNTHFFKWCGNMADMELIPNTDMCEFTIPTDGFIYAKERDKYRLSKFYRKWIKPEDILNNWEIFKWHCMLFINQKIYSEYELLIDDQEVKIRFKYYDHWFKNNHSVYIYKFDTNASCRILISKELCENQWNWKIPVSYITDQRVVNSTNIIATINKISDQSIRTDGLTKIEVLGDNLEFLKIEDGFIDLTNISNFNRNYIKSESREYLWMSIIVPKFLHEYPIMLPTDSVYRAYCADLRPVIVSDSMGVRNSKANLNDERKQVYIDMKGKFHEEYDGWKQMIRPIVLSDAFDDPFKEPSDVFMDDLINIRDLTIECADIVEEFRLFMSSFPNENDFLSYVDKLVAKVDETHEAYNDFLRKRQIEVDREYEYLYKSFHSAMTDLRKDGIYSEWFNDIGTTDRETNLWLLISPQIYIPRKLYDMYSVGTIIKAIPNNGILWTDINLLMNKSRFRRPIDELDFWTFEYDIDNQVWRPYNLDITRHFPDVYLLNDPNSETPQLNKIFKAFFFYSDTMNVLNPSDDISRATASWDKDMQEYEFDKGAVYRDIFMEKFYWMGVKAIYKGILSTNLRWEAIEYVIDNESYDRFNKLFLETMDPYFKMGLATYLKSSNYEFPFDDAVDKMNEAIDQNWLGYKRITNFETYLNKTWIPSYFDYITKIMDEWEPGDRLLKRPRASFDILRLLPLLIDLQDNISNSVESVAIDLRWIITRLGIELYGLNLDNINNIKVKSEEMLSNIQDVYNFTKNLDLDIYGIADINHIIDRLHYHMKLTDELEELFSKSRDDVKNNNVYNFKNIHMIQIKEDFINNLYNMIIGISSTVQDFDMERFMSSINNLYTYLDHRKENPDDHSLIGYINQFNDPWSMKVKELRNNLFKSSSAMYGNYNPNKAYTDEEVINFTNTVKVVKNDLTLFIEEISKYWTTMGYDKDIELIDKFEDSSELLDKLIENLDIYLHSRNRLISYKNNIIGSIELIMKYNISNIEKKYINDINSNLDDIVLSLSYIAGEHNKTDALYHFDTVNGIISNWESYLAIEEEIFVKLTSFTEPPIEFIHNLRNDEALLKLMIDYMDTVNIEYVPDTGWPTYADVYSVDQLDITSGGFHNSIDQTLVIPKLGVYKIDNVGEDGTVTSIADVGYRNTVYRDPLIQSNPYDAITNGSGMGITVKPIHSNHIPIVNDEMVNMIITRIKNSMYLINRDINIINPYNNLSLSNAIESIFVIESDWNDLINNFRNHMSNNAFEYVDELMRNVLQIIDPLNNFIDVRKNVNLGGLIVDIDNFIDDCYDHFEKENLLSSDYFYNEDNIRSMLSELEEYYGNGTNWNDASMLRQVLDNSKYPIKHMRDTTLSNIPNSTKKDELINSLTSMLNDITIIENTLRQLPTIIFDINPIIRSINDRIDNMPSNTLSKDSWYRIRTVRVALEGEGYKSGDVLEIIPELPKDAEGNDITDMADVILNDKILVKVKEVENGKVIALEPIMDYAIPYLIWGLRKTKTIIGKGYGLTVDIYSYELELHDSKLFESESSDVSILPQYNENDMFVFKFDNNYDLNIQYEVFYGGKQITNFVQRHITDDTRHQGAIDALYLNANEVSDLKNSSIYIPAEHYFIYRIDDIEIKDPGAGYAIGQEVFVDLDVVALKLKIAKLAIGVYKGIAELESSDVKIERKVDNPSSDHAMVITDSMNNIDDEFNVGYYDQLTDKGIIKGATRSLDPIEYPFISRRFDGLEDGDRNKKYMYPDVNMPITEGTAINGDPDKHFYLGSRIDNAYHMSDSRKWNGIKNTIPPTDPFIPDDRRVPTGKPIKGEYQQILQQRIHNSVGETNDNVTAIFEFSVKNAAMIEGDYVVNKFTQLPRHMNDWPAAKIGKCVIVENDETNGGHRMMYRLRTFVAAGFFVYDLPEFADYKWDHFEVDWLNCDFYPDLPSEKAKYPDAPWHDSKTYLGIQRKITDGKYEDKVPIINSNNSTYIHNLTVDDLSVWNCNKHEWEDLHDEQKWKLEVIDDPDNQKWGFKLYYLEDGLYSYDMKLFLNKIPETQIKNAELKRNAILNIQASITSEINNPAINSSVNTGRHLRIRKLFPYEQKETFIVSNKNDDGSHRTTDMDFKLAPYMHFRNELHLEDVKIYNKTAGRFENILDPELFEVRFKDDKAISVGYENQTKIVNTFISKSGSGFADGEVWAYNHEYGISVFGLVTSNYKEDGYILSFTPIHCVNPPTDNIALEFQVYQRDTQDHTEMAIVVIEFNTSRVQVSGDGYIHNVQNPYAPLPREFKIIRNYDFDKPAEYDVIISKTPRQWKFIEPRWMVAPTFNLPNSNVKADQLYILTSNGRFPLRNPSSGKPSMIITQKENSTDVTFLNLYKRYEHLEVRSVPYPMRSVYVQRNIPKSGYIDLGGKINKPLNKKYFEFWVNGKLMYDEVTIITPTKIFLHGLKSLKNLEIIEINRDPNEYFSDRFLEVNVSDKGRPFYSWNYKTYLDDALEGNLADDNYTPEEQEYLLSPVWKQVEKDHPEFKNYPPNVDIESDILLRVDDDDYPIEELEEPTYQFMVMNTPKIEGYNIVDRSITFEKLGFVPMTDSMIIDIMNEEWKDEIENNPYFSEHSVMTDAEWYGMTSRLYDKYGIRVHTLDESVYKITDTNILRINTNSHLSRIVKNKVSYDLN